MNRISWNYITDIKDLNLEVNKQYLICLESWNGKSSEWHVAVAYWFEAGCQLTLRESDETPHYHKIKKTGFYAIHDCGRDRFGSIFGLMGVKYYAEITVPDSSPDDFITFIGSDEEVS